MALRLRKLKIKWTLNVYDRPAKKMCAQHLVGDRKRLQLAVARYCEQLVC